MSYIRCTSNPEGLYIWGDVDGTVHICPKFNGNDIYFCVPQKIWDKAIRMHIKSGYGDISYKGFKIREVEIYTRKKLKPMYQELLGKRYMTNTQVRISYKNQKTDMWPVTWEHIIRGYLDDLRFNRRNKNA